MKNNATRRPGPSERYRGRGAQTRIYLGKLLRMFIYQNDWKVLPMAALIAGLVVFAVGENIFKTQEGTLQGCFALSCVAIWNGLFNSIQSVCRERDILKREHRAGLIIGAYVRAHMSYQFLISLLQTLIIIGVCMAGNVSFPDAGLVSPYFLVDFGITLFLITYASDMLALAISSLVRNTTTAMTVMPFVLIFELLFSGGLVVLEGAAESLTNLTVTKWGLDALSAIGRYNEQPMVTLWNTIFKFRSFEIAGTRPIEEIITTMERDGLVGEFELRSAAYNQNAAFASTPENVLKCWGMLVLFCVIFVAATILLLSFVDKDER